MRRRAFPLLLGLSLTAAALAAPVVSTSRSGELAVVTVRTPAAWSLLTGHGVRVVEKFAGLGSGVVQLSSGHSVSWLRSLPVISSVSSDVSVHVQGDSYSGSGAGVLASAALPAKAAGLTGAGVGIAVVDTGVSDTAALARSSGRLVDATDTSGEASFVDGYGHGTAMANLVAGGAAPSTGGAAVGAAPDATVFNVKVADAAGTTSLSKVLKGLYWVYQNADSRNIKVVLLALSADRPGDTYSPDPLTAAADKLRESGLTVVVAVGNEAGVAGDPAFDPSLVAVGALDTTANPPVPAPFSGGAVVDAVTRPDVYVAGVRILSILPDDSALARLYPSAKQPGGLWRGSGTSQASAIAAGVAADFIASSGQTNPDVVRAALILGSAAKNGQSLVTGRLPRRVYRDTTNDGRLLFSSSSWSSSSWSSSSWSASSWSSSSWSSSSWSSSSWSSSSWSSSSWSSSSWSASSWSSSSWSSRWWE